MKKLILFGLLLGAVMSGCAPTKRGAVREDTTLTGTAKELAPPPTPEVVEYKGPKLRVGVVNFQNKTPSSVLGIGEAAADILGTILQKTNRFIVIPQQDIQSILEQQKLGATGAIDPDTAAQMGKLLGLNAIVTGSVTAYSETEEAVEYLVGQKKKQIASVTVDYRIVDTTTGVQLMADSGTGIYEKEVTRVLGLGGRAGYDPDLRDGALRDALTRAMVGMTRQLAARRWSGRVAQVEENDLYINAGQRSGLNIGDKLDIFRPGKEIIDPVTKMKLGMTENFIGQAVVIKNDLGDQMDLSIANPTSGSGFKPGDIVKLSGK